MDDKRDDMNVEEAALELTDREIALAQGLDPDDVADGATANAADDVAGSGDGDLYAGEGEATDGGDVGKDADAPSWITDDVKALAGTYGLGDEDLADLDSEADFLRVARVIERRRAAGAVGAESEAAKPAGTVPATVDPAAVNGDDLPTIDPQTYIDAGYDEETVALARVAAAMQKKLNEIAPAIEQQQRAFAEEQHRRTAEEFHRVADELGRYGTHAKLTGDDDAKRKRLWEAAAVVAKDLEASGSSVPLKTILQRAEIVAFGDEIMAERKAELAKKVKSQSSRRRPVGRATATPGTKRVLPGDSDDPVAAIMATPDMQKFLKENGV